MAEDSKNKSMDIQKPGSSTPDSSSRPVIVANRAVIQDPMVKKDSDKTNKGDSEANDPPAKETTTVSPKKKVIEPPASLKNKEEPSDPNESKTDLTTTAAEEAKKPQPEKSDNDTNGTDDAAIVDAVIGSANKDKALSDETADEKRKQNARVLAESKKYNVPIGQVTKARKNRRTVFYAALIIVVCAAYLMIDFGIAEVPFELPFKIFNNS